MKKTATLIMFIFFSVTLLGAEMVYAKEQTVCPVMGGTINKEVFSDYNGERIYFCCPGCIATFEKNPEKYIKTMKAEGVDIPKAPPVAEKK